MRARVQSRAAGSASPVAVSYAPLMAVLRDADALPPESPTTSDAEPTPPATRALSGSVEALLFTLDRPVPLAALAEALGAVPGLADVSAEAISAAVDGLNAEYDTAGRAFRIEKVAGGLRVMSRPEYATVLAAYHRGRSSGRLSRAAVETLAVIAYQQPMTRARLEAVRGVSCGEVLRTLMDRQFVAIVGRAEELGRPMLYGTTRRFLDAFGLASIKDLPSPGGLQPQPAGARTASG